MFFIIVVIALIAGAWFYFDKKGKENLSNGAANLRREFPGPTPRAPRKPLREPRLAGDAFLQKSTLKQGGILALCLTGFLVAVGIIGQSILPVALMAVPLVPAFLFYCVKIEGDARRVEHELQPVKDQAGDLYVPSDWLKDL